MYCSCAYFPFGRRIFTIRLVEQHLDIEMSTLEMMALGRSASTSMPCASRVTDNKLLPRMTHGAAGLLGDVG